MNLGEKQGSFLSYSNIKFLHLNPTYLSQAAFGIDLMQLKVKLQKPTNKKQEEKRKLNRKNGRELSDYKLYTINFFSVSEWRNHLGKYGLKLKQHCINLQSFCLVKHS